MRVLLYSFLIAFQFCYAQIDTLYLNTGNIYFDQDTILTSCINNDSLFSRIPYVSINSDSVLLGGKQGTYISLSDSYDSISVLNIGEAYTMAFKTNPNYKNFYWVINEFQSDSTEFWDPDWFTINGQTKDSVQFDSNAVISGEVGDTIRIYILNAGKSDHSIHFHGYHQEVVFSSKYPFHKGRCKDTHPIEPKAALILELIPDKPGMYPVHDHNLVAVTGGGKYGNGMFVMLHIME